MDKKKKIILVVTINSKKYTKTKYVEINFSESYSFKKNLFIVQCYVASYILNNT